jgi:hypothetical protein
MGTRIGARGLRQRNAVRFASTQRSEAADADTSDDTRRDLAPPVEAAGAMGAYIRS